MQAVTTIGLDIAKSVFQVHGIDAEGKVVIRRQLKRRYVLAFFQKLPPCLIGIEACASSHHWSRELQALGHTVRLMPPAYVKPYVKRQKNDATDAEAICEAGHQGQHAICCDQDSRAAERPGAPPRAPSIHPPADCGDQCDPRPSCRVRDYCTGRAPRCRGAAQCRRRSKRQASSSFSMRLLEWVFAEPAIRGKKVACCDACSRRLIKRRGELGYVQEVLANRS